MNTLSSPYIEIAVAIPVQGAYTYLLPDALAPLAAVGKRVLVPFGPRRITGYILGNGRPSDKYQTKKVLDIPDDAPLFPKSMVMLFKWISEYYMFPLGETIQAALPSGLTSRDESVLSITDTGRRTLAEKTAGPAELKVLALLQSNPQTRKKITAALSGTISTSVINKMIGHGVILQEQRLSVSKTTYRQLRHVQLMDTALSTEGLSEIKRGIVSFLEHRQAVSVKELKAVFPTAPNHLKQLESSGFLRIFQKVVYRDPFGESIKPDTPPALTKEQRGAVHEIIHALKRSRDKGFSPFLLAGVTGSGKTEVYLRAVEEVLKKGKSALVLVPEIALISQTERRFRARFGDKVAVLHSGLSRGERFDQWMRIVKKETVIALGARSAVFAPFDDIGLIIVDEEHDTAYKQESGLRYNARNVALVRGKQQNCPVVLGSATPDIQSMRNAVTGKYRLLTLKNRIAGRSLPEVSIVDLKNMPPGGSRFFSRILWDRMREALSRNEQILLFINRRGYANQAVCGNCGETLKCRQCDISLTLHRHRNAYICHLCGYTRPSAVRCPRCLSSDIRPVGIGTEKVEALVKKMFPAARISRMDRDTTRRKGSLLKLLKSLKDRSVDIMIGTQMVVKGHDFPGITLVGILCADLGLNFPDFRASERTFQLLAQVAGRAGRGDSPGRVVLQTYNPDHLSVTSAVNENYPAFCEKELEFRKGLNYPPFMHLVQVRFSGRDKAKVSGWSDAFAGLCRSFLSRNHIRIDNIRMMGPVEAPISMKAGKHRRHLLFRTRKTALLRQVIEHAKRSMGNPPQGVSMIFNVDPYDML